MPYTTTQEMLLLAFSADTGFTTPTTDSCADAHTLADTLANLVFPYVAQQTGHQWNLVWGPVVLSIVDLQQTRRVANVMYVARNGSSNDFVIAIAGTDPGSVYDWLIEDADVFKMVPWKYGTPPSGALISQAVSVGLTNLQGLSPCAGFPGATDTLEQALPTILKGVAQPNVYVAGHSLGGALAALVALWLKDTQGSQGSWDPGAQASILPYGYAGPTPGNAEFANYYDGRLGNATVRVWNEYDIVPNAWNSASMRATASQYSTSPTPDPVIEAAIDVLANRVAALGYTQIVSSAPFLPDPQWSSDPGPTPKPLPPAPPPPIPPSPLVYQIAWQHIAAYYVLTGTQPWPTPPQSAK